MSARERLSKENILDRVLIDENGCWIWTRALKTNRSGFEYGSVTYKGTRMSASRASWLIHYGAIPDGMFVCHKCDVPKCVNPEHLFIGTASDNMRDMWSKGRHPGANANVIGSHRAKLTLDQLQEIRTRLRSGEKQRDIAAAYNVTQTTICKINTGKNWSRYV